jgi:hypothetical protein
MEHEDGAGQSVARRVIGAKATVLVGLVLALLLAIPSTTALAATAIMVGGLGQTTLDDFTMSLALNGKFKGTDPVSKTPWKRVNVGWPASMGPYFGTVNLKQSVDTGTANLVKAIKDAYNAKPGEQITVLGSSAGALVVNEAMRVLSKDPTAPPISAVKFVVLADATQKNAGQETASPWNPWSTLSGYTYSAPPATKYDLTVVNYEFDGWADFPDRWWNGTAVMNAMAGGVLLHAATWLVDLETADAVKTVTKNAAGGFTTTYLVRATTLPLVQLIPSLKPLEAALREQIEAGYSRYDKPALPGLKSISAKIAPLTETAAQARVEDVDTVDTDTDTADVPAAEEIDGTETADIDAGVPEEPVADAVSDAIDDVETVDTDAAEVAGDDAADATDGKRPSVTRSPSHSRHSAGADTDGAAAADAADGESTTRAKGKRAAKAEASDSGASTESKDSESE